MHALYSSFACIGAKCRILMIADNAFIIHARMDTQKRAGRIQGIQPIDHCGGVASGTPVCGS
jgi:hypothetical protein